jgi:hypothetical protein
MHEEKIKQEGEARKERGLGTQDSKKNKKR